MGLGEGWVQRQGKFGLVRRLEFKRRSRELRGGNRTDCVWPEGARLARRDEGSTLQSPEHPRGRGRSVLSWSAHSSFDGADFSECEL